MTTSTLIIPTLNEEQSIVELIPLVRRLYPDLAIIVADDGSKDNTQEIVLNFAGQDKQVSLLNRANEPIHGLTASVLAGIERVTTDNFIIMDADLQHPVDVIEDFIKVLEPGQIELVVGVRERVAGSWPWHRRFVSKLGQGLGALRLKFSGINCHDVLSGFFAGNTRVAQEIIKKHRASFEQEGYKVLFDLLRNSNKGLTIAEVPYTFNEREKGVSKINGKHLLVYFRSIFK